MEKRTKVLLLITKSNWGGAQRYVFDMAVGLPNDRFETVVAAGGNGELFEKLRAAGIRTISIPTLVNAIDLTADRKAYQEILEVIQREKPDIVHTNSSKAGMLGARAGRNAGVHRIVFTAHGWAFNAPGTSLITRIAYRYFHWQTVLRSDVTIAVSRAIFRQMAWMPFVRHKLQVVHHGISSGNFVPYDRDALLARAGITSKPSHLIGVISELHPVKGLNFFIEGMRIVRERFPAAVAVIFGSGEQEAELREAIRALHLTDTIRLCRFDADANRYLSAMDIFVQPSTSEALGYSLLEAGFAGTAVVATDVGGIPEIIESPTCGVLVAPRNPAALAEGIMQLLSDETLRTRLGIALSKRVRENFSLERMIRETIALYATH